MPKPRQTIAFSMRLPPEIKAALKTAACRAEISMTELAVQLITEWCRRSGTKIKAPKAAAQ